MPLETPCTSENVCDVVEAHDSDIAALWDAVFGVNSRNFVFTGNMGVPTNDDLTNDAVRYAGDVKDYSRAAAVINSLNPAALFLVGDMNYDLIDQGSDPYDSFNQEAKVINGFSSLLLDRRVYPVMGDLDFWIASDTTGDITVKMNSTYLRMFSYLPDAKRYYSIFDDKSNTEFYVLSSGRYKDYYNPVTGFMYPNDIALLEEQHDWLVQRTAASPAKNKVVIFHHPFTSIADVFEGTEGTGAANVFTDFEPWDFEAMGIRLIINGHSGNSFHLRKGSMHIVNSSSVIRSRMSLIEVADDSEPPEVSTLYGVQGYSIEYFSRMPMGDAPVERIEYPAGPGSYVAPKTEVFQLKCTTSGLVGEFISYNPEETTAEGLLNSKKVEHTFEISALP